jgi:hypothetical protein
LLSNHGSHGEVHAHEAKKDSSPTLARWGGAAACLAGVSYGALGYFHDPDTPEVFFGAVLPVLKSTMPALFLGSLVGLYSRLGGGDSSLLVRTGLVVGLLGTVLGVVVGVDRGPAYPYSGYWLALLFAGLTIVGVATLLIEDAPPLLGALVLASATLGWVSVLTDPAFPGVLVPMQPVHVAFAALFCMSAIVWGWALFRLPRSPMRRQP